jgi:hypothetical protein
MIRKSHRVYAIGEDVNQIRRPAGGVGPFCGPSKLPPMSAVGRPSSPSIAAVAVWRQVRHDCVLVVAWFESSEPHHAVPGLRRFPKQTTNARHWRASWRGESLCARPAESQGRFRGFVSGPEICVSRKPETRFAERRFENPLNSKEGQASGAAGTIRPAGQRGEQRPCRAGACRRLQL